MKDGDQNDKVQGKKLRGASGASGTNENGDKDTIKKTEPLHPKHHGPVVKPEQVEKKKKKKKKKKRQRKTRQERR